MITIPNIIKFLFGNAYLLQSKYIFFDDEPYILKNLDTIGISLAGILVGVGPRYANGCTSGHGICGLPRLSRRSIVAVLTFMSVAMITATTKYYYPMFESGTLYSSSYYEIWPYITFTLFLLGNVYFMIVLRRE